MVPGLLPSPSTLSERKQCLARSCDDLPVAAKLPGERESPPPQAQRDAVSWSSKPRSRPLGGQLTPPGTTGVPVCSAPVCANRLLRNSGNSGLANPQEEELAGRCSLPTGRLRMEGGCRDGGEHQQLLSAPVGVFGEITTTLGSLRGLAVHPMHFHLCTHHLEGSPGAMPASIVWESDCSSAQAALRAVSTAPAHASRPAPPRLGSRRLGGRMRVVAREHPGPPPPPGHPSGAALPAWHSPVPAKGEI